MREQLEAASISYGADHQRQCDYCADCTTKDENPMKLCHYLQPFDPSAKYTLDTIANGFPLDTKGYFSLFQ